jgi:diguanylate cyclase (GGDEF)-like protein
MQQDQTARHQVGLFVNPVAQRRVEFQASCGEQFGRLFLADGTEQAAALLAQQRVDLLVIDLGRFDRGFDMDALGQLVAQRGAGATLVICPFEAAGWLPALMAYGPLSYAIAPLLDDELRRALQAPPDAAAADQARLAALLATSARLQHAVAEVDDLEKMAERMCEALAGLPGVVHASLFHMRDVGELQLEAQHGNSGLNLARLLGRTERLMQSPMRHAFPGLLAACAGELALLDSPAKCGEPELALALVEAKVEMIVGLPLPVSRTGAQRGALCLMFDSARALTGDEWRALGGFAQLAGVGLRMAEMSRDNEQLVGRLAHMSTSDALTGLVNRRHGEHLLELEVRRARRYKLPLALIVFDVDRFKAINDQFGHPVGDAAIRAVAEAAQAALRDSDVLVRSGGEEFQIIAPHTSAIDALKVAEKIRLAIAAADIPGVDKVTVSLGVGQVSDQESADALTVRVDAALSRAKRAGRNCVELAMS